MSVARSGVIGEWHLDFTNSLEHAEFDPRPRSRQAVVPLGPPLGHAGLEAVGPVGGLVGMLGGLGGFFLPPMFAYTKDWFGFPSSTFFVIFVLTAVCALWMHWTVVHMLNQGSPQLADYFEPPPAHNPDLMDPAPDDRTTASARQDTNKETTEARA